MKKSLIYVFFILIIMIGFYYINNNHEEELILADTIQGDVDGNGKVGSSDYVLVRKHILKQSTLTGDKLKRADVNNDGKVSSLDFVAIRKIIINGPTVTPKPEKSYNDAKIIDSKYSYIIADVNVLDYGADPSGVKDSTKAFKDALAAARKCVLANGSCGGTVYVPKGKYLITDKLKVQAYTALVGDLEEGTTNGTILMIKHGSGSTDANKAAIEIEFLSSVQNIAFYYPDQKLSGGNATPYPPTIASNTLKESGALPSDYVTLENLNFVNSYVAIDLHASSVQFIRRIYGTPLNIGIINDRNWDTMKLENINFSPKYWLNSGLSNIPSKDAINSVIMNFNTMPAAIVLERLDWAFLANINIDGYFFGLKFDKSKVSGIDGGPEGEIYDSNIVNCYYPIYMYSSRHFAITGTTLSATGGSQARGIHISNACQFDFTINNSTISSTGDYAIYDGGVRSLSIGSSKINGKIGKEKNTNTAKITLVGNTLSNTGYESYNKGGSQAINKQDYKKRVVTKPKSKNVIKITGTANSDITKQVKEAINKLKSTGGIVYIPSGVYKITDHIDVLSGIEIRGGTPWAFHNAYGGSTVIETTYKSNSLFTLQSNSGINGIGIKQTDNIGNTSVKEYPYVIKGNGSNIYIMNVVMPSVWNGIDLTGCDNHYVEHVLGEFYNIGINVGGGSKNGIIRDSHFQLTMLYNTSQEAIRTVLTKQTAFKIGKSSNEIIFNTFIFGPGIGYHFDGASNFYAVGIGSDFSNTGIKISGNNTGQIINSLMVIKPYSLIDAYNGNLSAIYKDGKSFHYVETTSTYSGLVDIYNTMNWGSNDSIGFDFSGSGDLHINSGIIENSSSPAIRSSNAAQTITGIIIGYPTNSTKYQIDSGTWGAAFIGNLCLDGKSCIDGIKNNAGIQYSNQD